MRKKIIQLPRGYLSFSQISLWQSSRERYKKLYFDNDQSYMLHNSGLTFGTRVAEALENQKDTGDILIDSTISLLPQYDVHDKEICANIHTKDGDIMVLGKPDSLDSKTKNFIEYKTGRVKWTQGKAEKHLQLRFYAMLIYLQFGIFIDHTKLIWMETYKDDMDEVIPTGKVHVFFVKLTKADILDTMSLTSRVAKEIEAEYVIYVPPKEDPF